MNEIEAELKLFDTVIPIYGDYKGKKGIIVRIANEFNTHSIVSVRFTTHTVGLEDYDIKTILHNTNDLEKYLSTEKLIRPLRVGESAYIVDKLEVYYTEQEIALQGTKQVVDRIEIMPKGELYLNSNISFYEESINIPKTNQELYRLDNYSFSSPNMPKL